MSRAIGDHCLRPFVIAQPEVGLPVCMILPSWDMQRACGRGTCPAGIAGPPDAPASYKPCFGHPAAAAREAYQQLGVAQGTAVARRNPRLAVTPWLLLSIWVLCQRFCQRLVWLIPPCRRKHSCGTIMLCLGQGHQTMMWPAQHTVKGFAPASDASVCEVTVQPFPYCGIPLIRFLRTSCLQGFWHLCACHILSLLSSAATCVGANVHLALAEQ